MTSLAPFRCLYENWALTFYLLVNHQLKANFSKKKLWEGMNVNISNLNELNFSEVHVGMNRSGSLAIFT